MGSQVKGQVSGNPKVDQTFRFFRGHHETAIFREEVNLQAHYNSCKKKDSHPHFIGLKDISMEHLPSNLQDGTLLELIKSLADMSVRVSVKHTSKDRPKFHPDTKEMYPFYDERGNGNVRTGSGRVWDVKRFSASDDGRCSCAKCKSSPTPSNEWAEVRICTATHVVFDEQEAMHTQCRLFFDAQDSPKAILDATGYGWGDLETDRCWLRCATCNVRLINRLSKVLERWRGLRARVHEKYRRLRDDVKFAVIVSHPHGYHKMISVGNWTRRCSTGNHDSRYVYTTATCPGSSGAFLYILGGGGWMYYTHTHSGVNDDGNCSGEGRDL